jgi:hypothetical protein
MSDAAAGATGRNRKEDTMVTITARAKDALLQLRAQANMDDPELGLRLEADNSILGLFPDWQKPGDQVVEVAGATVLLIADDLADALTGVTIDSQTTDDGTQIVIATAELPNVETGLDGPDIDDDDDGDEKDGNPALV